MSSTYMNDTYTPINGFVEFDENGEIMLVSTMPKLQTLITLDNNNNKDVNHDSSGQYKCNICHKRFVKKSYCRRHELSHETTNLFNCNVCNKTFMHNNHLTQHMKLHKEKEHQCDLCGVKMYYKFNLDKHRKTHIVYTNKMGETKFL